MYNLQHSYEMTIATHESSTVLLPTNDIQMINIKAHTSRLFAPPEIACCSTLSSIWPRPDSLSEMGILNDTLPFFQQEKT